MFNIDENLDNSNPNAEVETLSGIFKVTQVVSKFDDGKFTQIITAILDPVLRILDINAQIEEDTRAIKKPETPASLIKDRALPPDVIRTQKLMGALEEFPPGIVEQTLTTVAKSAIPAATSTALSNVPTPIASVLYGLPNTFG